MRKALMFVMVMSAALAASACDVAVEESAPADGSREATALLRFVAYHGTTARVLEVEAGLGRAPARRIVAWRDGADGMPGTKDDEIIGSIDELASVSALDGSELTRVAQLALQRGWDDGDDAWVGTYDGVGFSLGDAKATLDVANNASLDALDDDAGLRADAVESIVAARPIVSVEQLAGLPRVGQFNLERLRGWAIARAEAAEVAATLAQ
ncbi:MAG: hypothetical protein EP329_19755 [Deltaproteobacteria bacterium]|nr:MAG: hypothetical protein EP329_19755 [Deltaproteobacteria bacterium]